MERWQEFIKENNKDMVEGEILDAVFALAAVLDKHNIPKAGRSGAYRSLTYFDEARDETITIKL